MSIFGKLFAKLDLNPVVGGTTLNEITSTDALHGVIAASSEEPVFLYKHSTACPTSARAGARVEEYFGAGDEDVPACYMIKVIESRAVSNAIEAELGVRHESPQLILVRDGKAVWHTSHSAIRAENIATALAEHVAAD